ncbi:hypothetical protein LK429_03245 [Hoylesella buccalis]|uniref:hypothetical protein n=1 Tax=Hoylesella buccalis TaxID=28127 RepID=UPI001D091D90|nr:hypothetical protein [Hoylesella buccalis]MCB6901004.1 hypothetical protein [Hoylesella buccalis]UEA63603.1 hypothetical protein LK429_03245 [Hoylesella buccalis]UWP49106.1 hypothetical protein NQ518_11385 [Hoylesella buccalis ATCC 35310]
MKKKKFIKPAIEVYQLSAEVLQMITATITTKDIEEGNDNSIEEDENETPSPKDPFTLP